MIVQQLTSVMVYIAAIAAGVFVVRYMRTGWHRSVVGRHTMAFMAVTATLLTLAVVSRVFPLPAVLWDTLRFTAFFFLDWLLIRQVVLLFRYQREGKKDDVDVS